MLHRVYGRKFSRPTAHRSSLFKNLVRGLVTHGKLTTTKQRAKAVVGMIDRMVSKVKKDKLNGSREAIKILGDKKLVGRLVNEVVPLLGEVKGGVTRLVPLGARLSDTAEMVRLEWLVEIPGGQKTEEKGESRNEKEKSTNNKVRGQKRAKAKARQGVVDKRKTRRGETK